MADHIEIRRKVAQLAERYLAEEVPWRYFMDEMDQVPNSMFDEDDDLSELCDQLEHEPKVGGLFGISLEENKRRLARIRELIAKLHAPVTDD